MSYARNGPPPSWAGWEGWEFWDPLRWAPKIGGCTPNRASEAGTLGVSRVFCPAHGPGHPLLAFGQFTLCPCKKQIGFYSSPCEGRKSATLGSSLPKAFPLGEASGSCNPTQKKRPKSGHVHGLRNRRNIASLRPTTPKPASGNERAIKTGGPGGLPPALFLPISREKWGPRRAGGPPGALRPEAP